MDPAAHTLFGVALANAGLAKRCGKGTTLALALASNAPDLDFLFAWVQGGGAAFLLCRRMLTHSVLGGPLLALLCALVLKPFLRTLRWRDLLGLCLLGIAGHVFLDLLNSFGVLVLYPLSRTRFALSWVFIVDPFVWAFLAMPLLLRSRLERLSRAALVLLTLYLGLCAAAKTRALALVRARAPSAQVHVFPEPFGPCFFRGVAREGSRYRLFRVQVLTGRADFSGIAVSADADPVVRAARSKGQGLDLDRFFRAPVWRRVPGREEAVVHDLQFRSLVSSRHPEAFSFRVGSDGSILRP